MAWAIHEFHRGLNLNFALGWSLGRDPKWLYPRAITGNCDSMQRFLSSAAFSAHNNFVFTPGLPFGSEPSLGSNIRQGSKTADSQVIQAVGWFPTMVVLPQGAFCLLFSNPTNGIFIYLWQILQQVQSLTHSEICRIKPLWNHRIIQVGKHLKDHLWLISKGGDSILLTNMSIKNFFLNWLNYSWILRNSKTLGEDSSF